MVVMLISSPVHAQKTKIEDLLAGATLILPEKDSLINVSWVLPPLQEERVTNIRGNATKIKFSIDKMGDPWILYQQNHIMNPVKGYRFLISASPVDMVHSDNGSLFITTENELGILLPITTSFKVDSQVVMFQPISALPMSNCHMSKGLNNSLYLIGYDSANVCYAVYVLQSAIDSLTPEYTSNSWGFRKVYTSKEKITAATGNGYQHFLAIGNTMLSMSVKDTLPMPVPVYPNAEIVQILMDEQGGIYYSTDYSTSYYNRTTIHFLNNAGNSLAYQNDKLYIFFEGTLGLAMVNHIGRIRENSAIGTQSVARPIIPFKVISANFYETGPPAYAKKAFASSFDKKVTRFISCELVIQNENKAQQQDHEIMLNWYHENGRTFIGDVQLLKYKPGIIKQVVRFSCGDKKAGAFYPGKYTVKLLLDGNEMYSAGFTITGAASPLQLIEMNDTVALYKRLQKDLDPNMLDENKNPLLHSAISFGSEEAVRLLLIYGADPNAKNSEGQPPLFRALDLPTEESLQRMALLFQYGAKVNVKDTLQQTLLEAAIINQKDSSILDLLVEQGADINATIEGRDPVIFLVGNNVIEDNAKASLLSFMLENGADPNSRNPFGETFAHVICKSSIDPILIELLINAGLDLNANSYAIETGDSISLIKTVLHRYIENKETAPILAERNCKTASLLIGNGVRLDTTEERMLFSTGMYRQLDQQFIATILDHNKVLFDYAKSIDHPILHAYYINFYLAAVQKAIEQVNPETSYTTALQICNYAKTLIEKENPSDWPIVYLYAGLLEYKMGQVNRATQYLQKYLQLLPNTEANKEVRVSVNTLISQYNGR